MARLRVATKASPMAATVQELGAALARQAETASERLQDLASQFREALPTNGAAALVSEGLASAKSYLGDRDFREVGDDVVGLIRRYPIQALLVGAGVGWVVTRRRMRTGSRTISAGAAGTRVKDVMTRRVEVVSPDASLKDVAAKMADLDVGAIPVCDDERLHGMITDRDIAIRAVARGLDPSRPVREIMTSTIRYVFEDEPVDRSMEMMKKHKIRRLPVIDREKRLVGIVSLGDLATEIDERKAGHVLERVSAASPTH